MLCNLEKNEAAGEHQPGNQGTYQKWGKELVKVPCRTFMRETLSRNRT